jgi:hypothetical protein
MNLLKRFKRQSDLVKPEELSMPILIIGVGGIGSWASLALSKMGCSSLTLVDPDVVETHNIASQFYKESDIKEYKVEALAHSLYEFTGMSSNFIHTTWQEFFKHHPDINLCDYTVICALDSLDERKKLFKHLRSGILPGLFIDARMGGEILRVFSLEDNNIESYVRYQKKLDNRKTKVHKEPCTARAISYNTFMSAAVIANLVKKHAKKQDLPFEVTVDMSETLAVY